MDVAATYPQIDAAHGDEPVELLRQAASLDDYLVGHRETGPARRLLIGRYIASSENTSTGCVEYTADSLGQFAAPIRLWSSIASTQRKLNLSTGTQLVRFAVAGLFNPEESQGPDDLLGP
jgi:hypothetical protein